MIMVSLRSLFRDEDDMYRHLSGVICKYKGEWIFIKKTAGCMIYVFPLSKCKGNMPTHTGEGINTEMVPASDFEFRSYHLGYYNTGQGRISFLQRKSAQVQQESISTQNILWPDKDFSPVGDKLSDPGFVRMLNNDYPDLHTVWKVVAEEVPTNIVAMAFEGKLALKRLAMSMVNVEYMGKNVGEMPIGKEPTAVQLYPAYRHLTRYLSERGGLYSAGSL